MYTKTKKMNMNQRALKQAADLTRAPRVKKTCFYCDNKSEASYTDSMTLKKFISDRAKIIGRGRSGLCGAHQRRVQRQIKYARHLSLLPFTARV